MAKWGKYVGKRFDPALYGNHFMGNSFAYLDLRVSPELEQSLVILIISTSGIYVLLKHAGAKACRVR